MSGAETDLWDGYFDEFLDLFCEEVRGSSGPGLAPPELERQVVLYVVLMGITWLLDVPALIRARMPDSGPATLRTDSSIKSDEVVRAPLQMLVNVLNLWESRDLGRAMAAIVR
jgi:hypothetical protein